VKSLQLSDNDTYYFDALAAEKPIIFIEKYLKHYEGDFAGKPFLLLPWQKQMVRDVFGWLRRDNNRRRIQRVYIEIGKSSGKSPLLSALGIYMLVADGEQGPQIYSCSLNYQQANITFDFAKKLFEAAPDKLAKAVELLQHEIRYKKKNGVWRIISGTPKGKHGIRPTCILLDEVHEMPANAVELYDAMRYNMDKRSQPLFFMATNAGHDRNSLCYRLHDDALKVLDGAKVDDKLYPVIYSADVADAPDSPETWAKAIPSLGTTITIDRMQAKWDEAKGKPADEATFRRLYLSQWSGKANTRYLNIDDVDACMKPFNAKVHRLLPSILRYVA
jgi:phage terminase large subunit-like protein